MRGLVLDFYFTLLQCEENGVQNSKQAQAAAAWGTSFEKLLEDPIGLQTFAVSNIKNIECFNCP